MKYEYHWEIQPDAEVEPHFLSTSTDSIADAATYFEENWGSMSILYIRKIAVTKNYKYDESLFEKVS